MLLKKIKSFKIFLKKLSELIYKLAPVFCGQEKFFKNKSCSFFFQWVIKNYVLRFITEKKLQPHKDEVCKESPDVLLLNSKIIIYNFSWATVINFEIKIVKLKSIQTTWALFVRAKVKFFFIKKKDYFKRYLFECILFSLLLRNSSKKLVNFLKFEISLCTSSQKRTFSF